MKRGRKPGPTTIEGFALANLKSGDQFLSLKEDRGITATASHLNVKVLTERVIVTQYSKGEPHSFSAVLVTII